MMRATAAILASGVPASFGLSDTPTCSNSCGGVCPLAGCQELCKEDVSRTRARDLQAKRSGGSAGALSDVCLVVPCIPEHVADLENLLRSAAHQDLLPVRIIVALSQTDLGNCSIVERRLQTKSRIPLEVSCTAEAACAGANRNRGAAMCREGVISFLDADDMMLPHRLAQVVKLMNEHDADALVHSYTRPSYVQASTGVEKVWTGSDIANAHREHCARGSKLHLTLQDYVIFHHAHVSVRAGAFAYEQQDPRNCKRNEDSEYVRRLIEYGFHVVYTSLNLSVYEPPWERAERPRSPTLAPTRAPTAIERLMRNAHSRELTSTPTRSVVGVGAHDLFRLEATCAVDHLWESSCTLNDASTPALPSVGSGVLRSRAVAGWPSPEIHTTRTVFVSYASGPPFSDTLGLFVQSIRQHGGVNRIIQWNCTSFEDAFASEMVQGVPVLLRRGVGHPDRRCARYVGLGKPYHMPGASFLHMLDSMVAWLAWKRDRYLWVWKPFIIYRALLEVDEGDAVLYADASQHRREGFEASLQVLVERLRGTPGVAGLCGEVAFDDAWRESDSLHSSVVRPAATLDEMASSTICKGSGHSCIDKVRRSNYRQTVPVLLFKSPQAVRFVHLWLDLVLSLAVTLRVPRQDQDAMNLAALSVGMPCLWTDRILAAPFNGKLVGDAKHINFLLRNLDTLQVRWPPIIYS